MEAMKAEIKEAKGGKKGAGGLALKKFFKEKDVEKKSGPYKRRKRRRKKANLEEE